MSSENNLELWEKVRHVQANHIKDANLGGHRCKSVDGLEMVRLITEAIGPIGTTWKYCVKWERFDDEKPLLINSEPLVVDGKTVWEQSHTAMIELSVRFESMEWQSFEQVGHTPYRYATKTGGIMVDKEYLKKSITDGLKKCLSLLGVAADVYSGDIDNQHYAAEVQDHLNIVVADLRAEKSKSKMDEIIAKVEEAKIKIAEAIDYNEARRFARSYNIFFSNRLVSTDKQVSAASTKAISIIESLLIEKQNEGTENVSSD